MSGPVVRTHRDFIAMILKALPPDADLPLVIVALEDAYVCCNLALEMGLTLDRAIESVLPMLAEETPK